MIITQLCTWCENRLLVSWYEKEKIISIIHMLFLVCSLWHQFKSWCWPVCFFLIGLLLFILLLNVVIGSTQRQQLTKLRFVLVAMQLRPNTSYVLVSRLPFEIELWQYDQMAGNKLLGKGVLPVLQLFTGKPHAIEVSF